MTHDWLIREGATSWECSWEESTRFQLRYFRSLSIVEKLRAVENMCKTARFLRERAAVRRQERAAD